MKKQMLIYSVTLLFVLLFIYSGVGKFLSFTEFHNQLEESPILKPFVSWMIWAVPSIEILIALLLIGQRWRLIGLYGCLLLMLLFTVYTILLASYDYYIPCSCGGLIESLPLGLHILINSLLTIVAWVGVHLEKYTQKKTQNNQMAL